MDRATALGLAVIPPALAIFFEAIHPIRDKYLDSSFRRDLGNFRPKIHDPRNNFDVLIETATQSATAAVEIGMLALTLVSVISSGFAILQEFERPYWPTILYVLFFVSITLYLIRLLAGCSLLEIDTSEAISLGDHSITRNTILKSIIYILNGLLILFAVVVLGRPGNWVVSVWETWGKPLNHSDQMFLMRALFFSGLFFALVALIIVYAGGPGDWRRRMVVIFGILALIAIGTAGQITTEQLDALLKGTQTPLGHR